MKVIVIEDEKPAARRLSRMLNTLNIEPEAMLHSVEESIQWLSVNKHPDLIFLDIQLSDGLSFEIFETITVKSAIIFTTAFDEYALKAFKLNSIDYLLKPIDSDELAHAVKQFKNLTKSQENKQIKLETLRALFQPNDSVYKKRFAVKIGQHLKMILVSEIECFYSENKATNLHCANGRNYLIDETLEQLEQKLNPETFFRVSRKYFININAVKDIISYTNSRLKIQLNSFNESDIIVSRERVKDFKLWIEQ